MSIKPVAWRRSKLLYGDKEHYYGKNKLWKDDVPLYAIPDTHRVVSVELLEEILTDAYLHPEESDVALKLIAIIEDKP